ncbi:MICOS complex subunit MIC25 isoform X1 [Perognathus longimembris pacificus]|uniref:MICOS complex subunit MIC25 isoform X1 n=1 Tax=Perognathus longimembris pacificus TaxID=214514 RepID=UPI00201A1BED|nr:MICOS complex subunit MIC25 isoform X1 [Perognathus longimembris pacificus]
MGSAESSESRRVSFEMDEEERVRVLQGIRLSESVVNRMKDSSEPSEGPQPVPPPTAPPSTTAPPTEPPPTETPPTEPPLTTLPPAASSPPTSPLSPRPTATRLPTTRSSPDSSFTFPQKEFKLPKSEPSGIQRPSDVTEEFKRPGSLRAERQSSNAETPSTKSSWGASRRRMLRCINCLLSSSMRQLRKQRAQSSPAGWSPCAQACSTRSSAAIETTCMRCCSAPTWSRSTSTVSAPPTRAKEQHRPCPAVTWRAEGGTDPGTTGPGHGRCALPFPTGHRTASELVVQCG